MKTKKLTAVIGAVTAVALSATAAFSLGGCTQNSSSGADSSAAADYAKSKLSAFSSEKQRVSAIFTDECFSKANIASMLYKADMSDEDLAQICRYLYLDSLTVTDETGKIVACVPADEKGKTLKETSDKKKFNKIVKGMSVKLMEDPKAVDGTSDYSFLAGVGRTDAGGAVVVGFTTDDYARTTGELWAESCGANVVIAENGTVISSTLEGADKGKALADLGITDDNIKSGSFKAKVGDKEYSFTAETIDTYTLLVAQ